MKSPANDAETVRHLTVIYVFVGGIAKLAANMTEAAYITIKIPSMSKIATDLEQSKRLLKAGLDPESADFFWVERKRIGNSAGDSSDPEPILNWIRPYDGGLMKGTRRCGSISYNYIPAWSLSKLLDIHGGHGYGQLDDSATLIEELVKSIVFLIDFCDIDSKWLVK